MSETTNYIYIGQYIGKTLTSKFIKTFTWSELSHTSAILIRSKQVIEAWSGGITKRSITTGHAAGTIINIYKVPCTLNQRNKFYNFMEAQIGKKYDFVGILGLPLRLDIENETKWFCSELVFSAALNAGITLLARIEPYKVTPGILNTSPLLEFVETLTL